LLAGLALVVGLPATLPAVEINVQSDTLLRGMSRTIGGVEDQAVTPGYEYLRIDAGQLAGNGFSFHSYGWGRYDFADNGYFKDNDDGELLYGYFQYADRENGIDVRLGRQNVFSGVSSDAVDGLQISGDMGYGFEVSVYGGQPVGFSSTDGSNRSGDSVYGGRLGYQQSQLGGIGISGKVLENESIVAEKSLGLDLALFLPGKVSAYGFSTRNLESKGWAEHSYEVRIPYQSFSFRPYFGQYDYEHYFGTGVNTVNPFRVLALNAEKLRVIGLDSTWKYSDSLDFGVKLKGNDYDRMNSSQYASGLATWHGEELTQVGLEIGYMNGDLDRQKYLLTRLFGYLDGLSGFGVGFISGDLVWARYDQPIYGRDNSLFVSLGTGRTFLDNALELKLSGDYSRDPYFDSDVRGMLALTYRFAHKS
jgi:hypothetical protein